ncbi:hypothetical protein GW17_00042446 [Ensete ventricosum]|nr:hypothetical protein GW17_00042446 [Ensete ventricosum]
MEVGLPNADEDDGEELVFGLGFRTRPLPPPPSSHDTDTIDGDLEKLGLDEKIADKLQFCPVEEKKCTGGVGAFETEESRGEKSEEEGGADGEKEGLAGKADVEKVSETSKKADAASKDDEGENMIMGIYYPQRPGQLDCAYYLRSGICRYGANCKFNHPPRRRLTQVCNTGRLCSYRYIPVRQLIGTWTSCYRMVHTGPPADRYMNRLLSDGTVDQQLQKALGRSPKRSSEASPERLVQSPGGALQRGAS